MSIDDYKKYSSIIKHSFPGNNSYIMYIRLMDIFVQDCSICMSEKYFGTNTKQKSKILFELQEKFLNFREHKV